MFIVGLKVEVAGVDGTLKSSAEGAVNIRPNFAYTEKDIQANIQRIFDLGHYKECSIEAQDTRDGVKLIFKVCNYLTAMLYSLAFYDMW